MSNPLQDEILMPVILVVEDYEPNLYVAEILLRQMNYEINTATSGYAALDKIKAGNRYAAILMDIKMQGLNGVMTTRHIREYEAENGLAKTPIIGMTAHILPGTESDCRQAGMSDFMTKPYTPEDLKARLDKLIIVS